MFIRSYFGVVVALLLITLFSYLSISGHYGDARRWIDGALFALMAFLFVRIWLR